MHDTGDPANSPNPQNHPVHPPLHRPLPPSPESFESLLEDWTAKRGIVGEFHRHLGFTPQQAENYVRGSLKNPMLRQIPTLCNYVEAMLRP